MRATLLLPWSLARYGYWRLRARTLDWLLTPSTRPCRGCRIDEPHDAHLTLGYRLRLRIHGWLP